MGNYGDSNLNSNRRLYTCSIDDTGIKVTVTVITELSRIPAVTFSAGRRYKAADSPNPKPEPDMSGLYKALISFTLLLPLLAYGEVRPGELPAGTKWYLHADLKQMRESSSGRDLYNWMDDEIFIEIHDEVGIDVSKEADRLTAFSSLDKGTVVVVEGNISKESQDKVLALAAVEAKLDTRDYNGKAYFHVQNSDRAGLPESNDGDGNSAFEDLHDEAFFSFAIRNKLIVASGDQQMRAMLDSGGKVAGSPTSGGALFVLTADKTFVQAGLDTGDLSDDEGGWQSNIIRNTEQIALLVSEDTDHIAIEARLVSADPRMAESIGGIITGLISLQAFNSDLDPELQALLQSTKILVDDKVLSISTVISQKTIVKVLKD